MKTHKDLNVWRAGIDLARNVYDVTRTYPKEETFGLVSQMRRAAVSIPSNISEGAARQSDKEFVRFLYTALGSASELDTQIEISFAVGIGAKDQLHRLQESTNRVAKMVQGLIRAIKHKQP